MYVTITWFSGILCAEVPSIATTPSVVRPKQQLTGTIIRKLSHRQASTFEDTSRGVDPSSVGAGPSKGGNTSSAHPSPASRNISPPGSQTPGDEEGDNELAMVRELLRPPPLQGVQDWGIPPESLEACDPEVEARYDT